MASTGLLVLRMRRVSVDCKVGQIHLSRQHFQWNARANSPDADRWMARKKHRRVCTNPLAVVESVQLEVHIYCVFAVGCVSPTTILFLFVSLSPGSRSANNVGEMLTALVSEVAGTTLFAYVIGALVTIVLNLDPQTRLRKQKVGVARRRCLDIGTHHIGRKRMVNVLCWCWMYTCTTS